ncbi:MAG TPA: outer membrane beta-barrel protein [Gemmatirosa sp.]|nr:outer membrane beta-barrel protein [Gemmatirosa sp.]
MRPAPALPAALALALVAAPAQAQLGAVNPISFGIAGGATVPLGDFADFVNTGFNVDGILTLRAPTLPVSFRAEVGYQRFAIKEGALGTDLPPGARLSGNAYAWQGVANLVYTFSTRTALVRPYLIGGVGYYRLGEEYKASLGGQSQTMKPGATDKFGVNGGVGLELPLGGFTGFAEARFHRIFTANTDTDLLPLRFGVRF